MRAYHLGSGRASDTRLVAGFDIKGFKRRRVELHKARHDASNDEIAAAFGQHDQ